MSRRLKDLYPCDTCGTGVVVRCRREIQFARCGACRERKRLLGLSGLRARRALDLYERHRASHVHALDLAPFMFEAASAAIDAAQAISEAAQKHAIGPAERAQFVRIALEWSKWATSVNDSMRHHLADEGRPVAELVSPPPEPIALSEPKAGHLRLLTS